MKSPRFLCLALVLSAPLFGQEMPENAAPVAPDATAALAGPQLPPEKLDALLGPVALYPDALIALILPAATSPSDVVLAARYLKDGGAADAVDEQPWDDSVKALARYPDVIAWMDTNLAWTKQMGEAFLAQPADVMNSVQRLRKKARATGALTDTSQQKVVVEDENIVIVPADPEVIYVPYYDPQVVYVERVRYVSDPWVTFGIGYSTGFWLGYGLDWNYHRVWCVAPSYRERYWRDRHTHFHRYYHSGPRTVGRIDYRHDPHYESWRPRPGYPRSPRPESVHTGRPPREISRPAPFPRDVSRSTVTGNTDVRSVVEPGPSPQRSHRSRSTATTNSVVPTTSPEVTVNPPRERNRPPREPGSYTPRSERTRPPQGAIDTPRPDSNPRPEVARPQPPPETRVQPQPQPRMQPQPDRVGPPPTGRTGLPPRENRPPPPPPPSATREASAPPRSMPVQERRAVDTNRRTTTETEER